ncbi:class II aldolase/adducin family protein, partial [Mycobacterium kansasii]
MKTNYDADEARIEVAEAARQLAWNQLVLGTAGNVSTKVGDLIAVTATGITLAKAKPEDVTL